MVSQKSFVVVSVLVSMSIISNFAAISTSNLLGYDCGVFTCMFADFVTKDCEPVFQQQHINQCRERIALSIMKNCAIE